MNQTLYELSSVNSRAIRLGWGSQLMYFTNSIYNLWQAACGSCIFFFKHKCWVSWTNATTYNLNNARYRNTTFFHICKEMRLQNTMTTEFTLWYQAARKRKNFDECWCIKTLESKYYVKDVVYFDYVKKLMLSSYIQQSMILNTGMDHNFQVKVQGCEKR